MEGGGGGVCRRGQRGGGGGRGVRTREGAPKTYLALRTCK